MSQAQAVQQLKACEAAILSAHDGESMWFALKGKREALKVLRGDK